MNLIRAKCGICNFPEYLPEAPNSVFGKVVSPFGVTLDSLETHYKKHHPEQLNKWEKSKECFDYLNR